MKINILKITLVVVGCVHIMFCGEDRIIGRKGALSNLNGIINDNKKEIIALGVGGAGGFFIGKTAEHFTQTINEEGKKVPGWWNERLTNITTVVFGLSAFGLTMRYYGKEAGIEIGRKEQQKKQIETIQLKIEKLTTDKSMHDFVKKNLIESYENYIKEIEKEMQDEYKD